MAQPIISVIVPTYNRAALVSRAIESVLVQQAANLEILVIDDGSTDNTADVLSQYKAMIRILHQSNAGVGNARNSGIQQASGDYLWFLDSDDQMLPGAMTTIFDAIRSQPKADVIYGWAQVVAQSGQRMQPLRPQVAGKVWKHYLYTNLTPIGTFVVRQARASETLFRETMIALEDWDFLLRLSFRAHFAYVPAQLVEIENQSVRRSTNFQPEQIVQTVQTVYEGLLADPISGPLLQPYRKYLDANVHVMLGQHHRYFLDDSISARQAFIKAIRLAPTFWRAYIGLAQSLLDRRVVNWLRRFRSFLYQATP